MTFTYGGDPKSVTLDEARFRIGDTDEATAILSDDEILFVLDRHAGVVDNAIPDLLDAAVRTLSRKPQSKQVGDLTITWGDLADRYRKAAAAVRDAVGTAGFRITGTSVAGKAAARGLSDRVGGAFRAGQFDNPDAR